MTIHLLNCFTCNAHIPFKMKTGTLCLFIETDQGPVLVDTGLGTRDYSDPTWFTNFFRVITVMPFDVREAAVHQIQKLKYKPEDIQHIILTHMHFDHCSGLPDFPHAKIHVHKREYESFTNVNSRHWSRAAYIPRNIAHRPEVALYEMIDSRWYDFESIRLPFSPEMYLIPLSGHSPGLCGLAVKTGAGWLFHVADAGVDIQNNIAPDWLIRLMLGPHWPRLRQFALTHPEVTLTASHMYREFFLLHKIIR
ncbi:MAG: MBL fold metallo-hydrolase [Anaerolineales bacterium]|nr:MBL fold metallo-hydrolase [Anaerolineales bacterium]